MEGLFVLIGIFNYSFGLIISYLFGLNQSLTLRVLAVLTLLFGIVEYQRSRGYVSRYAYSSLKKWILLFAVVLAGMGITVLMNGYVSSMMSTYLLSFGTRALGGILIAYALQNTELINKVFWWIEPFCVFYTATLLYVVMHNVGGSAITLDINRQTLSYAASYSAILLIYFNINFKKIEKPVVFSFSAIPLLNYILLVIDVIIISAGRGRGAFVLIVVVFVLYLFKNFSDLNVKSILSAIGMIIIACIGIYFISHSELASSGFRSMIDNFTSGLTDRSSEERRLLYSQAYEYAKNDMFIGSGAGSTAYNMGFYSHNIFIDLLVEYGFWGIIIAIIVFIRTLIKGIRYWKHDSKVEFFLLVFLCGFVMLLFSGSWYSECALWIGVCGIAMYDVFEGYVDENE